MNVDAPDLVRELRRLLKQIPHGRVTTYGDLANALGSNSAARWVGEYLANHQHGVRCRCHRVVRHDGEIGLFVSRDSNEKAERLRSDGIDIENGRVDLNRLRFDEFASNRPLATLIEQQLEVSARVKCRPLGKLPKQVAGVDVSYIAPDTAIAAYALVDCTTLELLWSTVQRRKVRFPYIPGFLAYREIPVLLKLLEAVQRKGRMADVVFVDGNGILHPRRAGIATQVGVATGCVSVGIAKSLLCGSVDLNDASSEELHPIELDGEVVGFAAKSQRENRPFFVSPGHKIDTIDAARLAKQLCGLHRLPEPIYHADAISRRAAKELRAKSTRRRFKTSRR